ncbi:MAG: hypothetical protein IJC56_07600 [Clostridia bacterium]|nr:hypothetical protein [Clostridia bacterium]
MKTQIAAIEFGTSKIVTVVARSGGLSRCDIIGSGTVPYAGYKDGEWGDWEGLMDAVQDSVTAAELEANTKIQELYVGVPGEFVHVRTGEAEIEIPDGGEITEDQINEVQDLIAEKLHIIDEDAYVLHRSPAWFSIDDGKKTMEVMGSRGSRLRACVSFILASPDYIQDMTDVLGGMGLKILGFLAPTLGSGLLLLSLEERDRVAMLIDVGYLNTEISMIEGDAVIYHAILGMGGGDITAALAYGLRISMREAEQIKRSYLFNPDEFDQDNFYEVDSDDGMRLAFPRHDVASIIENKTDELCDLINKTLNNDALQHFGPRTQVQLTGGGLALMRGGREYLAAQLGKPVKVPVAKSAKLNSPVYASALGLVSLIFDSIEQPEHSGDSIAKKFAGFFKKG